MMLQTKRSPGFVALFCILMTVLIGFVDWGSGAGIKPTILYVLPVAIASWYANRASGIGIGVLAVILWLVADVHLSRDVTLATLTWNAITRSGLFLLIVFLADGYRNQLRESARLALQDPLTGLPNRRAFMDRAQLEIARAKRHHRPLSLAYVDVDDFKCVNDRYGHQQGDEVLRVVGETLQRRVRVSDLPARIGGDEFVVLLADTSPSAADRIVRSLDSELRRSLARLAFPVQASIGVTGFQEPPGSVDELTEAADAAMYAVKQRKSKQALHQSE